MNSKIRKYRAEREKNASKISRLAARNEKLDELTNLCHFIRNCVRTGLNAKRWHVLVSRSNATFDTEGLAQVYDEMDALLNAEREVVQDTIPLVEADSRLGWEPSMLYMTDKWHLEWKLRQLDYVQGHELLSYRRGLALK